MSLLPLVVAITRDKTVERIFDSKASKRKIHVLSY
jgi:hypothetical protein